MIARHFENRLDAYPNVDGVVALTHKSGCGMASEGEPMDVLRRTMAGYARHPNFYAVQVVGLGCEANQINSLLAAQQLKRSDKLAAYTIQEKGGTMKAVREGIARIEAILPEANRVKRETVPASHLLLALQCGGSDGYSGISANPALGAAVDLLVRHGGGAILSETPEIYGAEHLLTRRALTREVGEKLIRRIKWWEEYTAASLPSWRSRSARWPRAAPPIWSTCTNTPKRSRPRVSSIWTRPATIRCRRPGRSPAAQILFASPPAAARPTAASPRPRSSWPPTRASTITRKRTWT
jgi:altronate dehydratase